MSKSKIVLIVIGILFGLLIYNDFKTGVLNENVLDKIIVLVDNLELEEE